MMPLYGRPLLELLLERLQGCRELDRIIVATGDGAKDDPIEGLVGRMGAVVCVRGSEMDVLGRFAQALEQYPSRAVVRICADNPLTDPEQVDALVRFFWSQDCDYACNSGPECGLPDGIGAEIMSADALRRMNRESDLPRYREHVTPYILDNPDTFLVTLLKAPKHLWRPDIRLDVDYLDDLNFLGCLCESLPLESAPFWTTSEIIMAVEGRPDLLNLRHHRG